MTEDTKLLLHCDGTDGSQTFIDEAGHTIIAQGDVQIDTAQKVFGTGSALFDGVNDYLSSVDSDDWSFGNGNFTIDFRARFSSVSGYRALIGHWHDTNQREWRLYYYANNLYFEYSTNGTGTAATVAFAWTPSINTWYHIEIDRSGADLMCFVVGIQKGGTHNIGTSSLFNSNQPLRIGISYLSGADFAGWMDEIRISKGVARHTANFTPPTEAYPYGPTLVDIDTDIRAFDEIPVLRDVNNDIRVMGEQFEDIKNDVRVFDEIPVLRDIDNDIRAHTQVLEDIDNDIRAHIEELEDINNDIHVHKEELKAISCDIRYTISSRTSSIAVKKVTISEGGYVNSQSVTVLLDVTNAVYMRFQNDINTGSWTAWESYASEKTWTLSAGDGSKKVYAQFKDVAGLEDEGITYADTILDTTSPTMTTIECYTQEDGSSIADSTYQTDRDPYFQWSIPSFSSGIVNYRYTLDDVDIENNGIAVAQPHFAVESGMTPTTSLPLTTSVAAGVYYYSQKRGSYAGGGALHSIAATFRVDVVYYDRDDDTVKIEQGTDGSSTPPDLPDGKLYLADVTITGGGITNLTDKRETKVKLKTYETSPIAPGTHILRVRAKGNNYNWSNTATFNLYITSDSPDIGIIHCYTNNTKLVELADITYQTVDNDPYFEWSAPAAQGAVTYQYYYTTDNSEPDSGDLNTSNNYLDFNGSPLSNGLTVLTVKCKDSLGNWGTSKKFHFLYGSSSIASEEITVIGNNVILKQSLKEVHVHQVVLSLRSARMAEFEEPIAFDANTTFSLGQVIVITYGNTTVFRGMINHIERGLDLGSEKIIYRAVGPRAQLSEEYAYIYESTGLTTCQVSYLNTPVETIITSLLSKYPKLVKSINNLPSGPILTIELIGMTVDQALQSVYDRLGHYAFYLDPEGIFYTIDLNSISSINAYFGVLGNKISDHPEYNILASDLRMDGSGRYNRVIIEGSRKKKIITVSAVWSLPEDFVIEGGGDYFLKEGYYDLAKEYIPQTHYKILKVLDYTIRYSRIRGYYYTMGWINPYLIETGAGLHLGAEQYIKVIYQGNNKWKVENSDRDYIIHKPSIGTDGKTVIFGQGLWNSQVYGSSAIMYTTADVTVRLLVEAEPLRVVVSNSGTADVFGKTKRIYNPSYKYNEETGVNDTAKMITDANNLLDSTKDLKLSGTVTLDAIDLNWDINKSVNLQNAEPARGWSSINAKVTSVTFDFDRNTTTIELSTEYLI